MSPEKSLKYNKLLEALKMESNGSNISSAYSTQKSIYPVKVKIEFFCSHQDHKHDHEETES
jgi:hypothetical protein